MIPERLTDVQRVRLFEWSNGKGYGLQGPELDDLEEACLDWHRALPKNDRRRQRVDWPAAVRNWIRKSMERKREKSEAYGHRPQRRWEGWDDPKPRKVH